MSSYLECVFLRHLQVMPGRHDILLGHAAALDRVDETTQRIDEVAWLTQHCNYPTPWLIWIHVLQL